MDIEKILSGSGGLAVKITDMCNSLARSAGEAISYDFRLSHNDYCETLIKKYCRARTFFVRDRPQFIDEFYVPSSVSVGGRTPHSRAELKTIDELAGSRAIITGSGGAGKTIFMRHLLLNSIETGVGYPVFIELRNLSDDDCGDIESYISRYMDDHGFRLGQKYVKQSILDGLMVIILDGFDEVPSAKRRDLERGIKKMMASAKSRIIISSRPDMVLEGWDDFTTLNICPLSLEDACELVDKIRFDEEGETKRLFVESLKGGLYKSHRYFLSNPLLLSIMLLTYGDAADIPSKFASFYEQAYTALFQKHDALKSGYRRERKTSLDIYDFAKLFSHFSAITYRSRDFRFSTLKAIEYVTSACATSGMKSVVAGDFIDDAKQAACLLIDDGLDLAFVHRSFQEYFTAKFINDSHDSIAIPYFRNYVRKLNHESEGVINILYEINQNFVEEHYIIPHIKSIFGESRDSPVTFDVWADFYASAFSIVTFVGGRTGFGYRVKNRGIFSFIIFMNSKIPKVPVDKSAVDNLFSMVEGADISIKKGAMDTRAIRSLSAIDGVFGIEFLERLRVNLISIERELHERNEALGFLVT